MDKSLNPNGMQPVEPEQSDNQVLGLRILVGIVGKTFGEYVSARFS